MYSLPIPTAINQPLYKKALFEKFNLKAAEREHFDADISKMALVARISPATVPALSEGKEIKGFYVLQVELKHLEYDAKNIMLLQKLIPQQLVFALRYEQQRLRVGDGTSGMTQLCIFHTRLQQSAWMNTEDVAIPLQGLTLDDVWNNIVATIGGLDAEAEETLEEQIIHREEHEKLLRQIEALEKRCRAENQTRKRYELHQQIVKLKELLAE